MTSVLPFLMFEGNAEPAITLYTSLIPNSKILELVRYEEGQGGVVGQVFRSKVSLAGQTVMFFDSSVKHGFTFTPATSLFVDCETEEEQLRIVDGLSEGGKFLMPLANYGFSRSFAWLNDKFGVSWQINLP